MGYPVFASGDVLNASDMNAVGLWKIASTTVTNQSAVQFNNCFSAEYDWYHLVWRFNSTGTTSGRILLIQPSVSGTPASASYVAGMRAFNFGSGATTWDVGGTSASTFYGGYLGEPGFAPASGFMDVFNPFATTVTTSNGTAEGLSSGVAYYQMVMGGFLNTTTSYDGVRFSATGDNITGTATVYGWRK